MAILPSVNPKPATFPAPEAPIFDCCAKSTKYLVFVAESGPANTESPLKDDDKNDGRGFNNTLLYFYFPQFFAIVMEIYTDHE